MSSEEIGHKSKMNQELGGNKVLSLIKDLENPDEEIQEIAALQLGLRGFDSKKAEIALIDKLDNSNGDLKTTIICSLGNLKSKQAIPKLVGLLNSSNKEVRWTTVEALAEIGDPIVIDELVNCLENESVSNVKVAIIKAIGQFKVIDQFKDKKVISILEKYARDKNDYLYIYAENILKRINKKWEDNKKHQEVSTTIYLQKWLKQLLESSKPTSLIQYGWKQFKEVEKLIDKVQFCNTEYRLSEQRRFKDLSKEKFFFQLCNSSNLSKEAEEELWEIIPEIDKIKVWDKCEELATTNPKHPVASIRRAKEFNINNFRFAVTISYLRRSIKGKVRVLLKVYSLEEGKGIPKKLKLVPLDEHGQPGKRKNGEIVHIKGDGAKHYIALPLSCSKGERISLEISLGDCKNYEHFVV